MSGLWDGTSGLWGGASGLYDGVSGLWSGASGLVSGGGEAPPDPVKIADAYIAAMTTPPSAPLAARIRALIDGLVLDGVWPKLDWLSLFGQQETEQAARLNVVNPVQIFTAVNAPVFAAGVAGGFTGNGTTQHLDSGWSPTTARRMSRDSGHIGEFIGTNVLSSGQVDLGTRKTSIASNVGAAGFHMRINAAAASTAPNPETNSIGYFVATRSDPANQSASKNGAALTVLARASEALEAFNFYALAYNNGGVAAGWSTRRLQVVHWGSGLTQADVNALYARLNTFLTAAVTGFDADFNSANLVYTDELRLVTRTNNTQRRAVRGLTGHETGRWYVELVPLIARLRFGGIVDSSFTINGAGGPAGTNRVGVEGNRLVSFGASAPFGFVQPGTVIRVAYYADIQQVWVKLDNGDWNNDPFASPVSALGGVSSNGLVGPAYVGATLRPVTGASVRYRLPGDPGYDLPSGYAEWAS